MIPALGIRIVGPTTTPSSPLTVGQSFDYLIIVTNNTENEIQNIFVGSVVDPTIQINSVTASQGQTFIDQNRVSLFGFNLLGGRSATLKIDVNTNVMTNVGLVQIRAGVARDNSAEFIDQTSFGIHFTSSSTPVPAFGGPGPTLTPIPTSTPTSTPQPTLTPQPTPQSTPRPQPKPKICVDFKCKCKKIKKSRCQCKCRKCSKIQKKINHTEH